MKRTLALVTVAAITVLTLIYFVYYSFTVTRNEGIDPNFFIFMICLQLCEILGLAGSSYHYSNSMKLRYGDSFNVAIKRVNQITVALIGGYTLSAVMLVCLIICKTQEV